MAGAGVNEAISEMTSGHTLARSKNNVRGAASSSAHWDYTRGYLRSSEA